MYEMRIQDWDGSPFYAYVTDSDTIPDPNTLKNGLTFRIIGWEDGCWRGQVHENQPTAPWKHAFPVPRYRRMTHRQLSEWCARGNGVWKAGEFACSSYDYKIDEANDLLEDTIRVCKWGSDKWIEPTVDLIDGEK